MELKFNGHQSYQLEAIQAVIDVFDGQPLAKGYFESDIKSEIASISSTDKGIANLLVLSHAAILENIQKIQHANQINLSEQLEGCDIENDEKNNIPLNFSIEMETGTGKTYVYLRSIYELNKVYGFKKFVIVVPSVAIREGVMTNLRVTAEHFQTLYQNTPVNALMYDSKNHAVLRNFATSNAIQILVINIDSFAKDSNIINTMRETGIKPIEYIQNSRPIVIVDEPQNMETPIRKAAIYKLNPLCTLRYSATHKKFYNLLYSLNPVEAYDRGLVKQIMIDGITSDNNNSAAFIHFKKLNRAKKSITAKVSLYVNENTGVKTKDITLKIGDDLFEKSKHRDTYKEGFVLNSINAEQGTLEFSGGTVLNEGQSQGGLTDEVLKFQIERTIINHFEKLKQLKDDNIKVLSLFFIDKVANYCDYSENGDKVHGKFALWFEEIFNQIANKPEHQGLCPFEVEEVHNGYFSSQKKGKGKDKKELWIDSKEKTPKQTKLLMNSL